MRVLVAGANGFIGERIVSALREAGHEPVFAVRRISRLEPSQAAVECDFARDGDPEIWKQRLAGIDAVVNCVGILREKGEHTFERVHVETPLALFRACVAVGVRRVVQISALGEPEDGDFIASKHRCDLALAGLDLDWLVLRPGLVYSAHGAYGGTTLLRALAALPGVVFLPTDGAQKLRPVAAEDVARAVTAALARPQLRKEVLELVGPDILTYRHYLLAWRGWFGLSKPRVVRAPSALVAATVACGEVSGRGPLCHVIFNLLQRGRVGGVEAPARMRVLLGIDPMGLDKALAARPSQPQDFLQARWYFLRHLLILALVLLWLVSGFVGLLQSSQAAQAALPMWSPLVVQRMSIASSVIDVVLGMMLLLLPGKRLSLGLMLALVVVYTLVIGVSAPEHWSDPFGGLIKNVPIVAILLTLLATERNER
jgi:uncharacterized protein YbjT (DUF2867 family)